MEQEVQLDKTNMKKPEEVPEGFVVVLKQNIVDNEYMGEIEIMVSKVAAERHLNTPKEERNPHWRGVRYKEVVKESAKAEKQEQTEESAPSNQIEIPRKRNRTV